MDLIYCAGGGKRFAEIAINAGFLYGSRLPSTVYFSPYFVDQDWKKAAKNYARYYARYFEALEKHKPHIATVLDFEHHWQRPVVLQWAEEAAKHAEIVVIIPKVQGTVHEIPRIIGGKPVRLGYSVPSTYGGTALPYSDFIGWPIHLLGGSPQKQLRLRKFMDVKSADCNTHMLMANYNKVFVGGKWVRLDSLCQHVDQDSNYRSFELSCKNIKSAWNSK